MRKKLVVLIVLMVITLFTFGCVEAETVQGSAEVVTQEPASSENTSAESAMATPSIDIQEVVATASYKVLGQELKVAFHSDSLGKDMNYNIFFTAGL